MAVKQKSPSRLWSRLHFLIRFGGLAGFMAAGVGAALAFLRDILPRIADPDGFTSWEKAEAWWNFVRSSVTGETGTLAEECAVGLLVGGVLLVAVAILFEVAVTLFSITGRRSAFG